MKSASPVAVLSKIVILSLALAALVGCGGLLSIVPADEHEAVSSTRELASEDTAPKPASTPIAGEDTPGSAPAPPSRQPTVLPTSQVDPDDLSVYRAALRPEFVTDLETVPDATRYFIQVTLSPNEPRTLLGVEQVRYTNSEAVHLDALYFRLYPNLPGYGGSMIIEEAVLNGAPVEAVLEAEDSALRVPLEPALAPGAAVDLTLRFRDRLPDNTDAGYGLYAFADNVYALAGFYPTLPVYDDEGWNVEVAPPYGDATFTDVALYQVHLTVPADLTVVTSGSTLDVGDNGDGTRTWVAVGGPMRDFYVAMSTDYQVVSEDVEGIRVNSYYRSAQSTGGELALGYATESLRVFNELFGPYPFAELDVVATPTNAGGIEYPGAIVVAQSLYDEEGGFFELATAHEVAHQWWYGLVGNDQLDEPWLDESLTNYSALLYYEETAGRRAADFIRERVFEAPYHAAREDNRDRAVAGPVASFSGRDYGDIVYGKGPLFFDALRSRLGDDSFFSALRNYLEDHRYGVAYPEDLVAVLEASSGQQIDDLYDFWILGQAD